MIHQTIADGVCSAIILIQQTLMQTVDGRLVTWRGDFICRFVFTMIIVVAVYMLCLTPFKFYATLCIVFPTIAPFSRDIYRILLSVCLINCCVNPFIYGVKFEAFKSGVRRMKPKGFGDLSLTGQSNGMVTINTEN